MPQSQLSIKKEMKLKKAGTWVCLAASYKTAGQLLLEFA